MQLFQHLGIAQAYIAACGAADWYGPATFHPDLVTSLILVCPSRMDPRSLIPLTSRLLVVAGDQGPAAEDDALQEGKAEALPFPANQFDVTVAWTVLKEHDGVLAPRLVATAHRWLGPAEAPRPSRPGPGRVCARRGPAMVGPQAGGSGIIPPRQRRPMCETPGRASCRRGPHASPPRPWRR